MPLDLERVEVRENSPPSLLLMPIKKASNTEAF
jgi:hypothetical protein